MLKTETYTLCQVLVSGKLTAELLSTVRGLQLGAILCSLINNSEYV